MYLQLLKLHDIVTNIDKHVSYLLKNANLVLINKNVNIFQQFFYTFLIVLLKFSSSFIGLCFNYCKSNQIGLRIPYFK